MIRPIDIRLNAAHPDYPLAESVTFTGSPSTVLIRGVPPNCGRWAITAVSVAATFPDGSTTTRAAVQSANGVWVATLPGTATSGRTANGLRILADGIDENGEAVTGYILGVADFAVASLGVTPAPEPGETSWQMLYFDTVPGVLRKGDVAKVGGVLSIYNGSVWEPFAPPVTLDDAVTPTSANGVKSSGIWSAIWGALSALPTGFASLYDWVVDQLAQKMPSNATGADIPVSGTDATKISNALNFKVSASNGIASQLGNLLAASVSGRWVLRVRYDEAAYKQNATLQFVKLSTGPSQPDQVLASITLPATNAGTLAMVNDIPVASTSTPQMDGTGSAGSSAAFARGDHRHPSDSTKLDKNGPSNRKIQWNAESGFLDVVDPNGGHLQFPNNSYGSGEFVASREYVDSKTPYKLVTKTISNGAVTLDDRAINAVAVSSSLASLTVNFPTATSGKARDFGLRLTVASGITTAPELALPQGVVCENADGEAPEIGADGAATILYFTETASGVFLVKGEVVTAIS